ncbi:hypothetical protein EON77_18680 [bacterium]|nr:MAG: hypothetical protein EON77_18680 [bacterium]
MRAGRSRRRRAPRRAQVRELRQASSRSGARAADRRRTARFGASIRSTDARRGQEQERQGKPMKRRQFLAAGAIGFTAAAAQPRSDVKITRVRLFVPDNFATLAGPLGLAETVVAVDTDAGVTGYGQGGTPDLLRYAASLLIGQDPMRTEFHFQRMYRSSIYPAGSERLHAVGALDCALWDLKGKLLGVPVYQLLGGRARDHVECYKSYGAMRLDQARDEARKTMDEGYRAVRFHAVGGSGTTFDARRQIADMVEICKALREGVGEKGEFIIDAHTRFSLADAVFLCQRVEPLIDGVQPCRTARKAKQHDWGSSANTPTAG